MRKYIEAEAALKAVCKDCDIRHPSEKDECPYKFTGCMAFYNVYDIPIADVQEVKHGKWIEKKHLMPLAFDIFPLDFDNYDEKIHTEWVSYWHCSLCDNEQSRNIKPSDNYCPHCGAKMDLK